jgi:hypothetical protein
MAAAAPTSSGGTAITLRLLQSGAPCADEAAASAEASLRQSTAAVRRQR